MLFASKEEMMEVRCAKCGVGAVITRVDSNGYSFEMQPGQSLSLLCPVIIERLEAKRETTEPEECPNLAKAITDRIEKFRRDPKAPTGSFS
jgi:hypothetical protein